jgi:NAD(P)-dependent dehydrogenase (short-subunit alcohol dehydrogenase family)
VFITGGARGIGAALARRLHERGAHVAIAGLEPELLRDVAASCGDASWHECDVTDREQVEAAVEAAVERLGGLDVVVANAGIAAQLPLVGGNPEVMERTVAVNVMGVYNTVRAAGPHIQHDRGYALLVSSLAAVLHIPLMGAYCASKAAVEALGGSLSAELRPYGARAGVAYFAEIDTDMTSRGFGTRASTKLLGRSTVMSPAPLGAAIGVLERGIARRSRRVAAPWWAAGLLPLTIGVQPVIERLFQRRLPAALEIAREEDAPLTTQQARSAR